MHQVETASKIKRKTYQIGLAVLSFARLGMTGACQVTTGVVAVALSRAGSPAGLRPKSGCSAPCDAIAVVVHSLNTKIKFNAIMIN